MAIWHITVATIGRIGLFSDEDGLLRGVRTVARVGGPHLLLFCLVDDHVHLIVDGDGAQLARSLGSALTSAGCAPRQRADVREVDGRTHLTSLVKYVVRQPTKHGLPTHPAVWPGSCAQDLLGIRRVAGYDPTRIAFALPRVGVASAVALEAGVWNGARIPATSERLRVCDPVALWEAAHACVAHTSATADQSPPVVAARAAWAALVQPPFGAACAAVGMPDRTFRRLRARGADGVVAEALARRIALLDWVATLPGAS